MRTSAFFTNFLPHFESGWKLPNIRNFREPNRNYSFLLHFNSQIMNGMFWLRKVKIETHILRYSTSITRAGPLVNEFIDNPSLTNINPSLLDITSLPDHWHHNSNPSLFTSKTSLLSKQTLSLFFDQPQTRVGTVDEEFHRT